MRLLPSALAALAATAAVMHFPPIRGPAQSPWFVAALVTGVGWCAWRWRSSRVLVTILAPVLVALLVMWTVAWRCAAEHPALGELPGVRVTSMSSVVSGKPRDTARSSAPIEVIGTVAARPQVVAGRCLGTISAGAVRIRVWDIPCDAREGQSLMVSGSARPAEWSKPYAAEVSARTLELAGSPSLTSRAVSSIEESLGAVLERFPPHARGLVPGVTLGRTENLDGALGEAMRTTQMSHLTAVSGGHVSILLGIVITLVGRARPRTSAALGAALVAGLVVLVGPEASVIRAVVMGSLVIVGIARSRSTQAVAALSFAVILVCVANPWMAMGYAFLLSASATAGIVLWSEHFAVRLARRMPTLLAESISISLTAQIACTPVLSLFASEGSIWGVLANVLVAPVIAVLTVTGIAGALVSLASPSLATLILTPAAMATWWIDSVARYLAQLPGSGIALWSAFVINGVAAALVLARRPGAALLVILVACVHASANERDLAIPDHWDVIQCDVGQGGAMLVRVDTEIIMVDVGPQSAAAGECVRSAGVDTIDLLVLTHAHADHIGGIDGVLSAAEVRRVWISPNMEPSSNMAWLRPRLEGIPVETVSRGVSRGQVSVLWPRATVPASQESANDDSIALHVDAHGGVLVLGDQGAGSQEVIAASIPEVAIMNISHHGSSDQSESLAHAASPEIAVISVGENTYGHPSATALRLYGDADIYTTIACGPIAIADGEVSSRCPGPE